VRAITAHRCLFADGGLKGSRVLVQGGAGSVGSGAIQLALWSGAWVAATVRKPPQAGLDRIVEVDVAANLASDLACLANGGVTSAYLSNDTGAMVAIPILNALL
jgi:NADPH2:quinone reductase